MLKCYNCGKVFETEEDLSTIVEVQELVEGDWLTTDRLVAQGVIPEDTETVRYAVFKGCPDCMGDEYLAEINA